MCVRLRVSRFPQICAFDSQRRFDMRIRSAHTFVYMQSSLTEKGEASSFTRTMLGMLKCSASRIRSACEAERNAGVWSRRSLCSIRAKLRACVPYQNTVMLA